MPHLSGKNNHGEGVQVCSQNTGNRIRSAGTGGHTKEGRNIVDSGIAFGRHSTGLLMMLVEGLNSLIVPKRII